MFSFSTDRNRLIEIYNVLNLIKGYLKEDSKDFSQ